MQFNYLMCLVKIILDSAGIDTLNRPLGAFQIPLGSSLAPLPWASTLSLWEHMFTFKVFNYRYVTFLRQEEEHAVSP